MNNNEINQQDLSLDDIFFAKCFTETDNVIDLEINHLTAGCISSKTNNFNLDEKGNLTVKTITATEQTSPDIDIEELINIIYPVGSIYLSVNNVNPSTIFGGTWIAFATGRTIVGVDTSQTEFNTVEKTGGNKTHTLTIAQIPSHQHIITTRDHAASGASIGVARPSGEAGGASNRQTVATGGGGAHNNLQPYITCYMWKRTS